MADLERAAISAVVSSGAADHDELEVQSEHIPGMTNIEFLGHRFHYQEILAVLLCIFAAIMLFLAFAKVDIQPSVYGVIGCAVAVIGLISVWNYGLLKTLAASAEKLKGVVSAAKQQLAQQIASNREASFNNEKLKSSNAELEVRVDQFKQDCGLMDVSVQELGVVENKLQALYVKHQETLENERKLNAEQEMFLLKQEESRLDREKRTMKLRLRDQFEDADVNRDGQLNVSKELGRFKQYLDKQGVKYSDDVFKGDENGNIMRWRCMEILDQLLDKHFSQHLQEIKARNEASINEREAAIEEQNKQKAAEAKAKRERAVAAELASRQQKQAVSANKN